MLFSIVSVLLPALLSLDRFPDFYFTGGTRMQKFNPEVAMWRVRREFGEHGGVTPSISRSSTFTVIDPGIMPEIFHGLRGPEKGGCFLYSRHFNPTTHVLARYLAAMEDTEFAVCTASGNHRCRWRRDADRVYPVWGQFH